MLFLLLPLISGCNPATPPKLHVEKPPESQVAKKDSGSKIPTAASATSHRKFAEETPENQAVEKESESRIRTAGSAATQGKYADAFKIFLSLAKEGNPIAQYNVGLHYFWGKGVEEDLEKAQQWFQKAGEQGHSMAQRELVKPRAPPLQSDTTQRKYADAFLPKRAKKSLKAKLTEPASWNGQKVTPALLPEILLAHEKWLADPLLPESQKAILYNADLPGANLQGANLQDAILQRANLSGANLQKANLGGANLKEANLSGANLQEAFLKKATLRLGNLQKAKLKGAILEKADLYKTDLQKADLSGAVLTGAKLKKANMREANLQKANLHRAKLEKADLTQANLQATDFSATKKLSTVNGLTQAQINVICIDKKTKLPEGFTSPKPCLPR